MQAWSETILIISKGGLPSIFPECKVTELCYVNDSARLSCFTIALSGFVNEKIIVTEQSRNAIFTVY